MGSRFRNLGTMGAVCLVASFAGCSRAVSPPDPVPAAPRRGASSTTLPRFGGLPVAFEKNVGQVAEGVRFFARGAGSSVYFTDDATLFVIDLPEQASRGARGAPRAPREASVVTMKLAGASGKASILGEDELPGKVNHFIGKDERRWATDLRLYGKLRVRGAYEGIDVVYYGGERNALEYDFIVAPGADASRIAIEFEGASSVVADPSGELRVREGDRVVTMKAPVSYQDIDGRRTSVEARYEVTGNTARLRVGAHDGRWPLVVDPIINFATYLGGSGAEHVTCLARDTLGNFYIAGSTTSPNLPIKDAVTGQTTLRGGRDAFVTKLNPAASQVVYTSYLGGTADEYLIDSYAGFVTGAMKTCAVDAQGRMHVATTTVSSDFPVTAGAFRGSMSGPGDATLTRLSPSGSALEYSTFIGGSDTEYWSSIALNGAGEVWMTGHTHSNDFPTVSPTQANRAGPGAEADVFVSRFNSTGTALTFSTYLGGSGNEYPFDIAVDAANNAYIVGGTGSLNFPVLNALQPTYGGGAGAFAEGDAWLTKFSGATNTIAFSTFLGGDDQELGQAVTLGSDGSIYVAGTTRSSNFPGAPRPAGPFDWDGWVAKLNAAGTARLFSARFGEADTDGVYDIAVNAAGNLFVAGVGTLGATTVNGCGRPGDRGIIGMLKTDGSGWEYLTPFGEANSQILIDGADTAYVAGWGVNNTIPIVGMVAQPTYGGGTSDAYLLKLARLPNATQDTGCGPCTGNFGSAGPRPCPQPRPVCLSSGECSAAGTCTSDADCGAPTSARVCERGACGNGCRGRNGNGCPAGKICTSRDETVGQCQD